MVWQEQGGRRGEGGMGKVLWVGGHGQVAVCCGGRVGG